MTPDVVTLSIGPADTAQTLAARYTIGGAAYAPAIIGYNSAWEAQEGEIGVDVPLAALGFTSAQVPVDWVKPNLLVGGGSTTGTIPAPGSLAGVPAWVWIAGVVALIALK